MLKKELASALGISPAMVSKLVARGMPADTIERAQRWRKRHLEPGRIKGNRFDPAAAKARLGSAAAPATTPQAAPAATPERPDHAQALALRIEGAAEHILRTLRYGDLEDIPALESTIRDGIRQSMALPGVTVRLPLVVWGALIEGSLADDPFPEDLYDAWPRAKRDTMLTAQDFASIARPWADRQPDEWLHLASQDPPAPAAANH